MAKIFLFTPNIDDESLLKPWINGELKRLLELNHQVILIDVGDNTFKGIPRKVKTYKLPLSLVSPVRFLDLILKEKPDHFYLPLPESRPTLRHRLLVQFLKSLGQTWDIKMVIGGQALKTFFSINFLEEHDHNQPVAVNLAPPEVPVEKLNGAGDDWLILNEMSDELWRQVTETHLDLKSKTSRIVYLPGLKKLRPFERKKFIARRMQQNPRQRLLLNEEHSPKALIEHFNQSQKLIFDPSRPLGASSQLLLTLALKHKKQIYPPRLFLQNENEVDRMYFSAFSN